MANVLCESPITRGTQAADWRNTSYWRPGDHVVVAPQTAHASESQRAVIITRLTPEKYRVAVIWRVRWVDAAGTLGDEAIFDERDLRWVRAIPTREPRYTPPARKRYAPERP